MDPTIFVGPSQNVDLLASLLPIIAQCADIFDRFPGKVMDDAALEASYLRLMAGCYVLGRELERTRNSIDPLDQHVTDLLGELEVIVKPAPADYAPPFILSACRYPKLQQLRLVWPLIETIEAPEEQAKRTAAWLDYWSKKSNVRIYEATQRLVKTCQTRSPRSPAPLQDGDMMPIVKRAAPAPRVSKAAETALNSLKLAKKCLCHPRHKYAVGLYFATYRTPHDEKDSTILDVSLSLEGIWEHVQISDEERRVTFASAPLEAPCPPRLGEEYAQEDDPEITQLCLPIVQIRRLRSHSLRFALRKGKLWNQAPAEYVQGVPLPSDPLSLEDFLSDVTLYPRLTDMTIRILAVLLSHAVYHFHGTQWMPDGWGPDSILFFQVSSTIPIKPYIQVVLEDGLDPAGAALLPASHDSFLDKYFYHPFPHLVMLGIMLMQIYLKKSLRSFLEEFGFQDSGTLSNGLKFQLAMQAFKKYDRTIIFSEKYYSAIQKCLDPNIRRDMAGREIDDQDLREVIYDNIIGPLEEELLQGLFPTKDLLRLDAEAQKIDLGNWGQLIPFPLPERRTQSPAAPPIPRRPDTTGRASLRPPAYVAGRYTPPRRHVTYQMTPSARLDRMWISSRASLDRFDDNASPTDISENSRKSFYRWKKKLLEVYDEFVDTQAPIPHPPRVAVLDTGLDLEHPDFRDPLIRQRICGHVNFTVPAESPERNNVHDSNGHGTHTAGLVLDFAPEAQVYIAKISEHDPETGRPIADAILHAVDTWHADIITMSFGFTTRRVQNYDVLAKAISHAKDQDVLLFAAASNGGATQKRTFPARHEEVVCVHATAADGVPSRSNPAPDHSAPDNFATIGEAIESSWPSYMCNQSINKACLAWKSGTSYATPIAAGIAAFLLLYAAQSLGPESLALLRRPQGLRAVFKELSLPVQGYWYLGPMIHDDHLFGKPREYIKLRLTDILANS